MRPSGDAPIPLAHSAPSGRADPDPYVRHVQAVCQGACERCEAMLRHASASPPGLLEAIIEAATFHDLGKLDPDTQAALRRGRGARLRWDHVDAGVAHLSAAQDWMAAWLVRSHHAPGLPEKSEHFGPDPGMARRLRGRRNDADEPGRHEQQKAHTDQCLGGYLSLHQAAMGCRETQCRRPIFGLTMRLALSCLVDADHSDSALFDTGRATPRPPDPRWDERLQALRRYVASLPSGDTDAERARNRRRAAFFEGCLNTAVMEAMVACEAPVGLGKTTAVVAYLLRRARAEGLRRLIVVAPYTNILTQTARVLRKALVLRGERPNDVVLEHHHRADFESESDRDLAVLWQAPVILTTAVSFFEALAACHPASLRKLHSLPGSAVFLDEAHAALPVELWPQNLRWLRELAGDWGCRFVFASGSLARFWEDATIAGSPTRLPELLLPDQVGDVLAAEHRRVRYARLLEGGVATVADLLSQIEGTPGPRLVILNTVQSAAVVARAMRAAGLDVLHLSTALTPADRERILARVERRLRAPDTNWTLVATSCVEAGVDLSFRNAFRERFATASIIQVGGRVNRHGEYDAEGGAVVYDFAIADDGVTQHPAAGVSADVLRRMMAAHALSNGNPSDVVTTAMHEELSDRAGLGADRLGREESARNFPAVEKLGRVIDADTRLVVVDAHLKQRLTDRQAVGAAELLRGSVQLWASKIDQLGLQPIAGRDGVYAWDLAYEPDFLGCMAGVLGTQAASGGQGTLLV